MSKQSHTAFIQVLCQRGLLPSQFQDSNAAKATVTLTMPTPLELNLIPIFVRIESIEELKELGGTPDEVFDEREDPYPMPILPASELESKRALHRDYCIAMKKYVYGNSKNVKEYAACINKKRLPINIALFTGEKLVVPAGKSFTFQRSLGPHIVVSYASIEMGNKSSLIFETNVTLYANFLSAGTDVTLMNDGGVGGAGGNGGDGSAGGGQGSTGGTGAKGGNGNTFTYNLDDFQITGQTLKIFSRGGAGGAGGKGGKGGKGDFDKDGGKGGNGGDGGKGGDGGTGTVKLGTGKPSSFTTDASGGAGGAGGNPGEGGDAGGGTSGNKGAGGSPGTPGEGGKGGKITFITNS